MDYDLFKLKVKDLKEKVNWDIKKERYEFYENLDPLFKDWKKNDRERRIPNLRDIFRRKEVDCLLLDNAEFIDRNMKSRKLAEGILNLVGRKGYQDKPLHEFRFTDEDHDFMKKWLAAYKNREDSSEI